MLIFNSKIMQKYTKLHRFAPIFSKISCE